MRCSSIYPGLVTLDGKPIRCEGQDGHPERHGHSFAARYWDDPDPFPVLSGVTVISAEGSTTGDLMSDDSIRLHEDDHLEAAYEDRFVSDIEE